MIATMGRAKTLGEKAIGLPDAGAISVTIILEHHGRFHQRVKEASSLFIYFHFSSADPSN